MQDDNRRCTTRGNHAYNRAPVVKRQSGATLLVVLVLIIGISSIAVSSITDTSLQFKMVRNDQFHTSAYLSAYSEINAQLGKINKNDETEFDETILDLLSLTVGEPKLLSEADLAGPHKSAGAFDLRVEYLLTCDPDHCPSPPGYTMSQTTKVLRAAIDSRAEMEASGAMSDQRQSFWYLLPQTEITTFD